MKAPLFFQIGLPAFSKRSRVAPCSGGILCGEATSVFFVGVIVEVRSLTLLSCPHICSFEVCTIKQNWTLPDDRIRGQCKLMAFNNGYLIIKTM